MCPAGVCFCEMKGSRRGLVAPTVAEPPGRLRKGAGAKGPEANARPKEHQWVARQGSGARVIACRKLRKSGARVTRPADTKGVLKSPLLHGFCSSAAVLPSAPSLISSMPPNATASLGQPLCLVVRASGYPSPSYQRYFSGSLIPRQLGPALCRGNLSSSHAGTYPAVVANSYGAATNTTTLSIVDLKIYAGLTLWGSAVRIGLSARTTSTKALGLHGPHHPQ